MATTFSRPPNLPLPSLPVVRSRENSLSSPTSQISDSKSLSSLHSMVSERGFSSSVLSGSSAPRSGISPTTSSGIAVPSAIPSKTLRKTVSIGEFPKPPKGIPRSNNPANPRSLNSSIAHLPGDSRISNGLSKGVPVRDTKSKKSPRLSGASLRSSSLKSRAHPHTPLNAGGDSKSVSNSKISRSSSTQSISSSPQESYTTSAVTLEGVNEHEPGEAEATPDERNGNDRHSMNKDGKGNVIVSVRIRPDANSKDGGISDPGWMVDGRRSSVSYKGREGGEYSYDNVFTAHDKNARVYDAAAKRLVRRVMEGYHGTVFAYGMTGTGKTFTMQGTATSHGVIPLAITDIFSFIRETPHREFLLRVSYLEIYNEKIHDLLSVSNSGSATSQHSQQEEIKLREDSKRGVYATPLKEEIVQSPTQLLRVISRGDNARRVAGTQFNARSSRSHAVVQIVVESRERIPGSGSFQESKRSAVVPGGVRVSTLSLIDLAGSEKAAENKERRTEGAHINKSLLTLGTVIARLSTDVEKAGGGDKDKHLPYRDSKLTRLLQPALSGNSLVSILCTIQIGSNSSTSETLNTLKFASRAKNNIVSHAKKAEEAFGSGEDSGSRALLDRYRMEIVDLRKQLENQSKAKEDAKEDAKGLKYEELEKVKELEAEQRHEEQMLEMQLARTALKERIEHLNRLILSSKSLGVNTSRSFSSMSMLRRASTLSSGDNPNPVSARSSSSHVALEVPPTPLGRTSSERSTSSFPALSFGAVNGAIGETCYEEDDSLGENGDGTASSAAQIQALQADLSDKNRYISMLEKRLIQARRSSQSRVSMSLLQKMVGVMADSGGVEVLLREKDAEIADLRSRLDDKDRMVVALRSAARKREVAELVLENSPVDGKIKADDFSNRSQKLHPKVMDISPVTLLAPSSEKKTKDMKKIMQILDETIQDRSRHSIKPIEEGFTA